MPSAFTVSLFVASHNDKICTDSHVTTHWWYGEHCGIQLYLNCTYPDYHVKTSVAMYNFFTVGSYMWDTSRSAVYIFLWKSPDGSQILKSDMEEGTFSRKQEWCEEDESDSISLIVVSCKAVVIMGMTFFVCLWTWLTWCMLFCVCVAMAILYI